jgi:outer membrane protein TolC
MTRLIGIIFVISSLSAGSAAAQTLPLTLAEAIERGLQTSHRLAEAIARGEAAQAAADQRHAVTRPQISTQAGYTRTNHVDEFGVPLPTGQLRLIYPDIPDNYRTRLDVQWPVYTGGRLEALERAARAEADASGDDLAAARSDLVLEISRSYWNVVTSSESVRVVEQAVVRIDAHLRDVRNQLDAGLVPPNDVLSVEAQASRQRMLAVQAAAARDIAAAELGRLVGAVDGTTIEALEPPEAAPIPLATVEEMIEVARKQRPERAALLKRIGASDERGKAAAGGERPAISAVGGVDYANPNPRIFPREGVWQASWDAGVNVTWALFDGGRVRSEIAEAAAAGRAARERLNDFDAALAVEVRQRRREAEAARAAIAAAADAVRAATEARRVVSERFTAGVATSTDVLDAQVALLQAELDRTQALAAAHLADARLTRAIGR